MSGGSLCSSGEGSELGNVTSCLGVLAGGPAGPSMETRGQCCRQVAPGEVLEQQMDADLMLDIASLGLEMDLENLGKFSILLAYIMRVT